LRPYATAFHDTPKNHTGSNIALSAALIQQALAQKK
jgi:hypothetical protein